MYGTLIFLAKDAPRSWVAIIGVVLVVLFVLLSFLDYPLSATWPAFVGVFLLGICALAFVRDLPDDSPLPLTPGNIELWAGMVLACLYLAWGGIAGRRDDRAITLFDSTGLAIQDLAVAALAFAAVREGRVAAPTVRL